MSAARDPASPVNLTCQHITTWPYRPVLSPLLTMTSQDLQDQLFVLVTGANRWDPCNSTTLQPILLN